jgi:electron transport complex protein RnfD
MDKPLIVSASPHTRDTISIPRIMWSVAITLVPVWAGAVYFMGIAALVVVLVAVASAVVFEAGCQKLMKKKVTISDGSAVVTGMLLAFTLPPAVPLWIPVLGSFFAIVIGKQVFGGLGNNPMNPALLGRAFLMASWPVHITTQWCVPRGGTISAIDAVTNATPLNVLKSSLQSLADANLASEKLVVAETALSQLSDFGTYQKLFIGQVGGCIGETSALLIVIGALYLLYKRYIGWRIPFFFIVTVALLGWVFGGVKGTWFAGDPLFYTLTGGVFLGAFYMATDMVTSPLTQQGKYIFGIGCGIIIILIRLKGGYPEGVCYAILLMNLTVPLIDRYTRPKKFGEGKKK